MDKLKPHYGYGVSGDRFWPRPALVKQILIGLERSESLCLFGPRRTGKSSLLRECARLLREDADFTVIEINGEGMDAVASLFNQIVASLPNNNFTGFKARIDQLKMPERMYELIDIWRGKGRAGGEDAKLVTRHWASVAQAITQSIPDMESRPVLFIDELTYLCENLYDNTGRSEEVTRLLAMLREWRGEGMGMVIASSIGIRQYLRKIGVSRNHLTGCNPIHVGPLDPANARMMLAALARQEGLDWWDESIAQAVMDQSTDLLPACLQFAFKYVVAARDDARDDIEGPPFNALTIDAIFKDRIRPNFEHEFFRQFDERFGEYETVEQDAAREMFRCIVRSTRSSRSRSYDDLYDAVEGALGQEKTDAVDLSDLIRALEDDGFLIDRREQDQIAFASRLVEAWWLTRDHRRKRRRD